MGSWLRRRFGKDELLATGFRRTPAGLTPLDLANPAAVSAAINDFKPDLVFLLGAVTSPAACERRPDEAWAVNTTAAAVLAELAGMMGFRLVFTSTDLVFDGQKGGYGEDDETSPLSLYGQTKAAAERNLLSADCDALVVRLPLIVGAGDEGPLGTLAWMAGRAAAGESIPLFTDEYRSPQAAGELARGLELLVERAEPGIWHLAGPERMSRYELGRLICSAAGWPEELLEPVSQAELNLSPARPADVSLDIGKVNRLLGTEGPRPIGEVVGRALAGPKG